MTKAIKCFWHGYLDLFGQPPVDVGPDFNPNGFIVDMEHLADDWRQVGLYLNNAMIGWERQQVGWRNNDTKQKK